MVRAATAQRHAAHADVLAADVGKRIREARQERGMSLAQLGGEDLSRSFLSLVELGRSRISLRALAIVAKRLDLPVSFFLDQGEDSEHIASQLLLDEAEIALEQGKPDQCLRLLDQAGQETASPLRAGWLRGRALSVSGRPREAAQAIQAVLPLLEKERDRHFRAEILYTLGATLYGTGSFDEAIPVLRRALDAATLDEEDQALSGKIVVTIGHIHYVQRRIDLAIEHYRRALDLFGTVRDYASQGSIYAGLSRAYRRQGDLPSSLRYSRLSVATFEASRRLRDVAAEINNIAVTYEEMGNLDDALAAGQDALERAQQLVDTDLIGAAHGTLSSIFFNRGDLDEAMAQAGLAVDHTPSDDPSPARATALHTLAEIAESRGEPDRADALFEAALQNLRETNQQTLHTSTALAYSLILQRRGDVERALQFALEAAQGTAPAAR
jgi:tetratricopeptide (TPR) repeat protein